MRYDTSNGWVITRREFLSCGFAEYDYNNGKNRKEIHTTNRGCKGNPVEIIVSSLAPKYKNLVEQKFVQLKNDHADTMVMAKVDGANMTDAAVKVTANTLEINAPYIKVELEEYVRKQHSLYIPHYLQSYSLNKESIIGYSKICALGTWVYAIIKQINSSYQDVRVRNRHLRSFRANILEALDLISFSNPGFFEIKVPRSGQKFDSWVESIVSGVDSGKLITDIITIKRAGNSNPSCLTDEQCSAIKKLYMQGNALSLMEIYQKILAVGNVMQWWRNKDTGIYEPPSYGTIRNIIEDRKNVWSLERTSSSEWGNMIVPSITREYPKFKNMVWGIDGTAQNENVYHKGKVRQYAYAIVIFDYATFRLLEVKITLGMNEKSETLIDAVKNAIKESGYKPNVLQSDQGPGFTGLREWCETEGIKCIPAALGIARAKPIELLIGLKDSQIDRFNKAWTGGNRTALGKNSHPSESYVKEGGRNARSFEVARRELKNEAFEQWNNHIINEREGKQCLKTPIELWNDMDSDTPKLSYIQLAQLTGKKHTKKLTIKGLDIQHELITYTYFPLIDTDEQLENAYDVFASIPRIGHQEASQLDIYVMEYGEPAPVFKGNKFWGMWSIKPIAPMFAALTKDTENYNKLKKFQDLFISNAKEEIKAAKEDFNSLPCADVVNEIAEQALTGRKRVTPLLDKANLNASEIFEKAGRSTFDAVEELEHELGSEYKQIVDTTTGEIITYKTTKK